MSTDTLTYTLNVNPSAVAAFHDEIANLSRRAARLGLATPHVIHTGDAILTITRYDRDGTPETYKARAMQYRVTMPPVAVNGWKVIGRITPTDSGRPFFAMDTGYTVPASWEHDGLPCDHCNHNRARNLVHVVAHTATGEVKRVGSTCVGDFTGNVAADRLFAFSAELVAFARSCGMDSDGCGFGFGGGRSGVNVETLATIAHRVIARYGYTSVKVASEREVPSTKEIVRGHLNHDGSILRDYPLDPVTDADRETARAALAWGQSLTGAPGSFEYSMNVAASCTYADWSMHGVIAYLPEGYRRSVTPVTRSEAWVGTVKGKVSVGAKLVSRKLVNGDYGTSTGLTFVTADGCKLQWWASSVQLTEGDVGATFQVSGTVKAHDTWKEDRITKLTRCKLVRI